MVFVYYYYKFDWKWNVLRSQINHFVLFILLKERLKRKNSRRCGICNIEVHRASNTKHLSSKNT